MKILSPQKIDNEAKNGIFVTFGHKDDLVNFFSNTFEILFLERFCSFSIALSSADFNFLGYEDLYSFFLKILDFCG